MLLSIPYLDIQTLYLELRRIQKKIESSGSRIKANGLPAKILRLLKSQNFCFIGQCNEPNGYNFIYTCLLQVIISSLIVFLDICLVLPRSAFQGVSLNCQRPDLQPHPKWTSTKLIETRSIFPLLHTKWT